MRLLATLLLVCALFGVSAQIPGGLDPDLYVDVLPDERLRKERVELRTIECIVGCTEEFAWFVQADYGRVKSGGLPFSRTTQRLSALTAGIDRLTGKGVQGFALGYGRGTTKSQDQDTTLDRFSIAGYISRSAPFGTTATGQVSISRLEARGSLGSTSLADDGVLSSISGTVFRDIIVGNRAAAILTPTASLGMSYFWGGDELFGERNGALSNGTLGVTARAVLPLKMSRILPSIGILWRYQEQGAMPAQVAGRQQDLDDNWLDATVGLQAQFGSATVSVSFARTVASSNLGRSSGSIRLYVPF